MFDIKEELKKLPLKPGVYIMKNKDGEIIYIGKAIRLKNRVSQYFQNSKNQSAKVISMVNNIAEFEYIVTDTEMEALILECNLIKEHRPKYNISLKDDKMYPYIKVTLNEEFPRIFVTRNYKKDGSKYYGPITDATAVKETVELIHKIWSLRKCKKVFPRDIGKERPCLNYHIGQCSAPCDKLVTKEDYRKDVRSAMDFLEGKHKELLKDLKDKMEQASNNLEFEIAASYRDKIRNMESVVEKQKISHAGFTDSDIIALATSETEALVQMFFVRSGKMIGREHFLIKNTEDSTKGNIITEFVKQFYSGTAIIPKEIVLEEDIDADQKEVVEGWLSSIRESKVIITVPQKGEKHKLVELARKNAVITMEQFGEKIKREQERTTGALQQIKDAIGLEIDVKRIESYDISHTQGFNSVGSMVVFENGKEKRSDYRKFKIKTIVGANDYASMEEVLARRINRAFKEKMENSDTEGKNKFSRLPDLIMVDGGKAQISAVESALASFGISIPVCGMVKDDKHRSKALLYMGKEIYMPLTSEGFRLVTRIQDEVHRFAVEYHRKLRDKEKFDSVLNHISGIGEARRKLLMAHFGDINAIKSAEVDELLEAEGMTIKSAEAVYSFFRDKESNS